MVSADSYTMKIKFWGTRGSIPTPGRYVLKYGGNTPCVEVRCGDTILIFDAGSGMRELGGALIREFGTQEKTYHVFISHTHWDHIQGFPFFSAAYLPSTHIEFYGGAGVADLKKLIYGQMEREYFPVTLSELASTIHFTTLNDPVVHIGDIKVEYGTLIHPSLAFGFRVSYKGKVLVYATDNELTSDDGMKVVYERSYGTLIKDADILIADCQYTTEEYENKRGWGHSSIESVVEIADSCGVKNLFAFHHDPLHTDDEIDIMIDNAASLIKTGMKIYGAKEKSTVYL